MTKMSVTFHASPGDSKVVEMFGHTFFDGKTEEVDVPEDRVDRLKRHPQFEVKETAQKDKGR